MNAIILDGRLTKDPELKSVKVNDKETGKLVDRSVVNFTIAVENNRSYRKSNKNEIKDNNIKENEKVENKNVEFISSEIWGKSAENFAKLYKKGDHIKIEGYLATRENKVGKLKIPTISVVTTKFNTIVLSKEHYNNLTSQKEDKIKEEEKELEK